MDDTRCRGFFLEPVETYHRQYEALRAFFYRRASPARHRPAVRLSGDLVALHGLQVSRTSASWRGPPLFVQPHLGRPQRQPQTPAPAFPEPPVVADARALSLTPGRRLRTRVAGLFLFLPLLARVHFEHLVSAASYPGSAMVPATSALLSLLVLKLLDKERRSHINDFNFDEAVGLCAGLNVPPKKLTFRPARLTFLS
jgi:hypothetical protein